MIETPFKIGDVKWWPRGEHRLEKVPCPVCAGTLRFVVELSSGERLTFPCDACDVGMLGPRGTIDEWVLDPRADRFEIAGVSSLHAGIWWVESTTGDSVSLSDLRDTEAEALDVARKNAEALAERNMQSRQHKRAGTRKASWSVRYHRERIADAERSIAWHRAKIAQADRG
jgi:hypothetical protein